MIDDPNEPNPTQRDLSFILGLLGRERTRLERRLAKSSFVPPEGSKDMTAARIERIRLIETKIERMRDELL